MSDRDQTGELLRTASFGGIALVLVIISIVTYPRVPKLRPMDEVNKPLFPEFSDPQKATSLEIARVDQELGKFHEFKVQRTKRGWVIPSHADYPADAEDQMRDAATLLTGLIVKDVVPNAAENLHEEFGVLEPDKEKTTVGQKGVGVLVRMEDAKGKELASLVIGKKVKGDETKRFVRIPGQDPVYVVELDLDKLSTKFEDWIERDLLQLTGFDLEEVTLKDYSVVPVQSSQGRISMEPIPRMEVTVKTDTSEGWVLKEMLAYNKKRQPVRTHLSDVEELNDQALDDLKSALDDLEIVDVRRKPEGLGANLKADRGLLEDRDGYNSLVALGYYPFPVSEKQVELLASNGELVARMKDGVEYVLRFGKTAGIEEGTEKLNRYLFVTARVNEDKFPMPELETPPEIDQSQEAPKPEESAGAAAESGPANGANKDSSSSTASGTKPKEKKKSRPAKKSKEELKAERERILKENQRKLEERNEKRQKAVERVKELNNRFADWYYVISEDVYKKMRLRRADLIKEKETAEEKGFGIDAFRKLEKEGLKKEEKEQDKEKDDTES